MENIIFAGILILFLSYAFNKYGFTEEGRTEGICKEVKVEFTRDNGSPYNEQLRGMDSRMYRPYIEYSWKGEQYLAKAYRAYQRAKIFPGDRVKIRVSKKDKEVVDILS